MADFSADIEEDLSGDIYALVKSSINNTLKDVEYDSDKVNNWSTSISDHCLRGLQGLGKNFKYIVTVVIMQHNGAGLHTASAALWDARKDGYYAVPYEAKTLHCIVTVYAIAIYPSLPPA